MLGRLAPCGLQNAAPVRSPRRSCARPRFRSRTRHRLHGTACALSNPRANSRTCVRAASVGCPDIVATKSIESASRRRRKAASGLAEASTASIAESCFFQRRRDVWRLTGQTASRLRSSPACADIIPTVMRADRRAPRPSNSSKLRCRQPHRSCPDRRPRKAPFLQPLRRKDHSRAVEN